MLIEKLKLKTAVVAMLGLGYVIITNHKCYEYPVILEKAKLVIDTCNALGELGKNHPKVVRL
jgi:hypothetical protein